MALQPVVAVKRESEGHYVVVKAAENSGLPSISTEISSSHHRDF
jgi:hypothetical protein